MDVEHDSILARKNQKLQDYFRAKKQIKQLNPMNARNTIKRRNKSSNKVYGENEIAQILVQRSFQQEVKKIPQIKKSLR